MGSTSILFHYSALKMIIYFLNILFKCKLSDAKVVMNGIKKNHSIRYSSLTPNLKGFGSAVSSAVLCFFFIKKN
jgi:hypothetical protein